MSIVSPIVACGAVVPFAISIATGERPERSRRRRRRRSRSAGAVLASAEERRADAPNRARAIALAVASPRSRSASSPTSSGSAAARAARSRRSPAPASARSTLLLLLAAGRARVAPRRSPLAPADRRDRPLRRGGERALRPREPPRAALARLGARLALPGDDGRCSPTSILARAADADRSSPASRSRSSASPR